jgi:hypothetical protein
MTSPAAAGPFRPDRADWAQAGLVALALFALYAASAPRTVAAEDDGLFVLSSYFLGIEHPPGYPLFTLIGHLFTKLPIGSVAYRVHLASAFFGALACATVWLCARRLVPGRLPAFLAALGLGLSPVFWSQSIIADVYSLNAFLFALLVYLGLTCCPPQAQSGHAASPRILYGMALVFGLSLSNHWPLMLLVAPAFVPLLWPLRYELLKRLATLLLLVAVGLLPYVWLVRRSWTALPISFDGPLESLPEIWFFISRAGYAGVDRSVSSGWLDQVRFFTFLGSELFLQFAVLGTLIASVGFAVQWRVLGRRAGAFLTVAFLMPTVVLLLLLGFDYNAATKHVFHVYPLPAYAIAALWMALGYAWLQEHYLRGRAQAAAACAATLALILSAGSWTNLMTPQNWSARYAQTVLRILPPNAIVFGSGDPDLVPMAYFHMIENWRPDITLYHPKGLVLGNRLFHPLRTDEETAARIVREMIDQQVDPVVFTASDYDAYARRDRWLYVELDKSSRDPRKVTVDIPEEAVRFFEEAVAGAPDRNAWVATFQNELRRRYAFLLARSLPRERPGDARTRDQLERLGNDFYGALGIAEGLVAGGQGHSAGAVGAYLDRARDLMPSDVHKQYVSRYFHVRGAARLGLGDAAGARSDFGTALDFWPAPANSAIAPLEDLYRQAGDTAALKELRDRVNRLKQRARGG